MLLVQMPGRGQGEKQNQVSVDFKDQRVMLKEQNVPRVKVQYPR